ncbi:MAG: hypothetical protein AAFQ07_10340 [Chloroflexota bacterium]
MTQLVVQNLTFNFANGQVGNRDIDHISKFVKNVWVNDFTYTFEYGKSYMLFGLPQNASWTIAWIIGGLLDADSGMISKDGKPFIIEQRRKESWFVIEDEIKQFGFLQKSVRWQVRQGINSTSEVVLDDLLIRQHFMLTPERYNRPLRQMSSEKWRASMAIGFAHGKQIFCFPHLKLVDEKYDLLEEYGDLWLHRTIKFLCNKGAIILIPSVNLDTEKYFDEVVFTVAD